MRKYGTIFSLLMLWTGAAIAQPTGHATLTGTVFDSDDGEPLPGVHVFIASSMIGTTTDAEGTFRLDRVPLGAHRLVVSMIGFEPATQDIFLEEARTYEHFFDLHQRVYELGPITVEGERERRWQRRLERFIRLFIGETRYAEETEILNPLVLDFEHKDGLFTAWADEPLIIENRALGYRIQYLLFDFSQETDLIRYQGEPLFEELTPESPKQAAEWEEKRREAFNGSMRHLLLSLWEGRTPLEGFKIYTGRIPANSKRREFVRQGELQPGEILQDTPSAFAKELTFPGTAQTVQIVYLGELEDDAFLKWRNRSWASPGMQISHLQLEYGPAIFDYKGDLLDPYSVTMSGYMAFSRVADSLPKEYRPSNWSP